MSTDDVRVKAPPFSSWTSSNAGPKSPNSKTSEITKAAAPAIPATRVHALIWAWGAVVVRVALR